MRAFRVNNRNFMKFKCFLVWSIVFIWSSYTYASSPSSYTKAKHIVYQLFRNHPATLYCNCKYNNEHQTDLKSCHMDNAIDSKRAHVIEIEHMVPTDTFGHQLTCWQNSICERHGNHYKGRKCCEKLDFRFRHMESELYNLWPAVGLVNIARSNYSYGIVDTDEKFYGCSFKINRITHEVEPSDKAKGIVARATLFMSDKYKISLSDDKRQLYLQWHKKYPPTSWEKEWASQVALIEGYNNPYILNR